MNEILTSLCTWRLRDYSAEIYEAKFALKNSGRSIETSLSPIACKTPCLRGNKRKKRKVEKKWKKKGDREKVSVPCGRELIAMHFCPHMCEALFPPWMRSMGYAPQASTIWLEEQAGEEKRGENCSFACDDYLNSASDSNE